MIHATALEYTPGRVSESLSTGFDSGGLLIAEYFTIFV